MSFRSEVVAKVRAHREKHPELYCRFCLWRISTPYAGVPCPRHTLKLVPGEDRRADFDDVSTRTEIVRSEDLLENAAPAKVCLQCFRPLEVEPGAPVPLHCPSCESQRYARPLR